MGTDVESDDCRVLALVVGDQVRWTPAATDTLQAGMEMVVVATRRGIISAVRRGARRAASAAEHPSAELADHQEVRQPEGVQGRVLGGVQASSQNASDASMPGAEVVEAGVDHTVVHDAYGQPAE